jgi:hypothetical protein
MDAWLLGTLLGLLIALNVVLVLRLEMCHKSLIFALKSSVLDLNSNEVEIPDQLITDVKSELVETVQDLIGQMRVPTAIDHLAGVAANIMQMREQWKIQKEASQMDGLISAPPVVDTHGSP